jgi:NADPH:quinone reductase-like Zn-dependent oxidoreductase
MFQPPMVLGHEPAGVVEAVGDGVRHIRATTMFGLEPDDRGVFVRLAYRRLGWDGPA